MSKPEDVDAEATGKNLDSNDFKRAAFDKSSPSKPMDRPPRNNDDGFAIKRSDKPRAAPQEEEKRGPPTFSRGPPRNTEPKEDTGFARGNFAAKKAEESGPPKRSTKPAADSGSSGFGFRNSNAARGGKGPAKK